MDELKLKFGKMVASIEKPINKSTKYNKAMKCKNNTNCNTKELFQHFVDYNVLQQTHKIFCRELFFSGG